MHPLPIHPPVRGRSLSRRTVLRGAAGAAVSLPWLEAMAPRRGPLGPPPVRMCFLFVPNGMLPSAWQVQGTGSCYEASPTLEPLVSRFRERTLILSGLQNANSFAGEGHYVKTTALLSGAPVRRTGGKDLRCGTTVDQLAAQRLGHLTPLPSLELGIEPVRHAVDMGYSTVYGATLSWRAPDRPASKEVRPRLVFDRMFRRMNLGARDRSVLDVVLEDGKRLQRMLGRSDRSKLEEHLDGIRSLERRIASFDRAPAEHAVDPATLVGHDLEPSGLAEHVDLMLELIALAFRTDTTRIVSLMFGNAVSNLDFRFVDGVDGTHHTLSHHRNEPELQAQYARINRWHVERLAELCGHMDRVTEDDRSLLDSSMVFFGSGLRDGNRHDPRNLPITVVGSAGGRLRTGAHRAFARGTPLTNLYVSMLDAFGCPVERFGDSTAPLDGVLAG